MYHFGGHILCDRCKVIIVTNFNFLTSVPHWEIVKSKRNKWRLDFCTEQCRIIHCRGRKYYRKKLEHMANNGVLGS